MSLIKYNNNHGNSLGNVSMTSSRSVSDSPSFVSTSDD